MDALRVWAASPEAFEAIRKAMERADACSRERDKARRVSRSMMLEPCTI